MANFDFSYVLTRKDKNLFVCENVVKTSTKKTAKGFFEISPVVLHRFYHAIPFWKALLIRYLQIQHGPFFSICCYSVRLRPISLSKYFLETSCLSTSVIKKILQDGENNMFLILVSNTCLWKNKTDLWDPNEIFSQILAEFKIKSKNY
jgi:hypothetical protein